MLQLKDITVSFDTQNNGRKTVLKDLNLTMNQGEFVLVLGDNGTGKSTLFNVISGFVKTDTGAIELAGKDITHQSYIQRCQHIAHVLQDPSQGTLGELTIFENMVFAHRRGQSRRLLPYSYFYDRESIKKELAILGLGLENRLDDQVKRLSGGQRQALSVVMALAQQPQLLLLDEVTAALDHETGNTLMNIINTIVRKKQCTVLMITHNTEHVQEYGDRRVTLKGGVLI